MPADDCGYPSLSDAILWRSVMEKLLVILFLVILVFLMSTRVHAATQKEVLVPKFPAKHPYLMITTEEIEHVRARVDTAGWARQTLNRILKDADGFLQKPPKIPAGISSDHRRVARATRTVALAYVLTGDQKYFKYARKILLHYADVYTTFPLVSRGRTRLTAASSLYETGWYIPLVYSYDLVYEQLTKKERQHIEAGIIRPGLDCFLVSDYETDPRTTDWHFRCYNFQAWHLAAIGLAGFCLKDQELIDYAIDSQFGFRHQVGHDIHDDGLFWERSLGYHFYTLSALVDLTEAAWRCGVDLYTLSEPDTYSSSDPERELNYSVDGDNGPKTLKMMFDAPFYYTFPDGSCAQIADSGLAELRARYEYRIAYARYGDPKYGWLIQTTGYRPDLNALIHGLPEGDFSAPILGTGQFANTGQTILGSSLYPATGFAILRGEERDPESTCVLLNYGPHGGGHGHPDRLSMVLYAHGKQWVRDFGSFSYDDSRLKSQWTAQTVSHSTIVADEISHLPQGDGNSMWTTDNISRPSMGKLQTFSVDSLLKVARAYTDSAIPGVKLDRTVALFDGFVVDVYEGGSKKEHQYDWVLHVDGQPDSISVSLRSRSGSLGAQCGYQHVRNVEEAGIGRNWTSNWTDDEGRGLRVTVLGETGTRAIRAQSMKNKEDEYVSTLIARRNASSTRFVAVFDPYREAPRIAGVSQYKTDGADKSGGFEFNTVDGSRYRLLFTDNKARYQIGDLIFRGDLVLIKDSHVGQEISIVGGRYLNVDGQTYTFKEPTNAYLR